MSNDDLLNEPPKNRSTQILVYVVVGAAMFGAGMLLESQLAAQAATATKLAHDREISQLAEKAQQEQQKAAQEKQALTESLDKEREDHAKDVQAKDKSLAAVGRRAAGVRTALEADLSAARTSGEACTSRIARISEAVGGVFDSVGEVAGLAEELGRENQQLKADNQSLSEKLTGWQKWNAERMQRVTVVGQKG